MRMLVTLALAAGGVLSASVYADQVLEINDGTLTQLAASSPTAIQDVLPRVRQRGVGVDGSLQRPSIHGALLAGNPNSERWNAQLWHGDMALDVGQFSHTPQDVILPADVPWPIGRSYNALQDDGQGGHRASGGYQGNNWFQDSQPELIFVDETSDEDDLVYLVYGADRFIELRRAPADPGWSTDTFRSTNGAAGAIQLVTIGTTTIAAYYDQMGFRFDFFWFDSGVAEGSLWRVLAPGADPAGPDDDEVAFLGHKSNPVTARSSGFTASDAPAEAYDSEGRKFEYGYDTNGLLVDVTASVYTGSTWEEVARVDYTYYAASDSYGDDGDLRTATVTLPGSIAGSDGAATILYRYYTGTFDQSTNPGHPGALKHIVMAEGYRRYDWELDQLLDDDPIGASDSQISPFSSYYFEYDTSHRVSRTWDAGSCGCSGSAAGELLLTYEANTQYVDSTGYDAAANEWWSRTVLEQADGSYITQYFDEAGQPLHRVVSDGDPSGTPAGLWVTKVVRDSSGLMTARFTPSAVDEANYIHTIGSSWAIPTLSSGLSYELGRVTGSSYFDGLPSSVGFVDWYDGFPGSPVATSGTSYWVDTGGIPPTLAVGDLDLVRPVVGRETTSSSSPCGGCGTSATDRSFDFYGEVGEIAAPLVVESVSTLLPVAGEHQNGPGEGTGNRPEVEEYNDRYGRQIFVRSDEGYIGYTKYASAQVVLAVRDGDTTKNGTGEAFDGVTIPTGFASAGSPLHHPVAYSYDPQGRLRDVTLANADVVRTHYSTLGDGRNIELGYDGYEASPERFYGPVSVSLYGAGKRQVLAEGVVALDDNGGEYTSDAEGGHVDETESDLLASLAAIGTVSILQVTVTNSSGDRTDATRSYTAMPTTEPGVLGTHYDESTIEYDGLGRISSQTDASGTIARMEYDARGLPVEQWMGTVDGGSGDNMTLVEDWLIDGGADGGNGYVTRRREYVSDSAWHDTLFTHDARGKVIIEERPEAPHILSKFDELGRRVATGLYSSATGLTVSSDPTSVATNRVGLAETKIGEDSRVFQILHWEIDAIDGSADDSIAEDLWYDKSGRVIKRDGAVLGKTFYDRLGRVTHQFVLAKMDDTEVHPNQGSYYDAVDVAGDIVLEERQAIYESQSSNVLLEVVIERDPDDRYPTATLGALDLGLDADDMVVTASDLKGRAQIAAHWYDNRDRRVDTVMYGTNGGATFTRSALTVPPRSDTELRTTYVFGSHGLRSTLIDQLGTETRYSYNSAGKPVLAIYNYVDGVSSDDSDVHQRYDYVDGLLVKDWMDLDGDGVEDGTDQVTEYVFGTTKGTGVGDSAIATTHLLSAVAHADSTGSSDRSDLAYDARGKVIWSRAQDGTISTIDRDGVGRNEKTSFTSLGTGVDARVRRVERSFDSAGRPDTVTQYDAVTGGSVLDEVRYTHSGWGAPTKIEQDHNSAIGGSLLYSVDFAYEKAGETNGRNVIRRSAMTLPNGDPISFTYQGGLSHYDDGASRVTMIGIGTGRGSLGLVDYEYSGVANVTRKEYLPVDVFWDVAASGYSGLDRFNRVTQARWTKDLVTDRHFYDTDVAYDRADNVLLVDDQVQAGLDVSYSLDPMRRLVDAKEGDWNGSVITSLQRRQEFELDALGNWTFARLDLNGDGLFTGTGEYKDDREHGLANEIESRDLDDDGTPDATMASDAVGRLVDDGTSYKYVYDAMGRMVETRNRTSNQLVAEYEYNGLGHRISARTDTNSSGKLDAGDPTRRFVYDDQWRVIAVYEDSSTDPREQFVYHAAGGLGLPVARSLVDSVVIRDRATGLSSGGLDERVFYCQNWRNDVVALIDPVGHQIEQARYTAYSIPDGLPAGDCDSDGDVDTNDLAIANGWILGGYDVRGDINLDGVINSTDTSFISSHSGDSLGLRSLSLVANDRGYASYGVEASLLAAECLYHVRNRVMHGDMGRWLSRDPMGGFVDTNHYEYIDSNPIWGIDPSGLIGEPGGGGSGGGGRETDGLGVVAATPLLKAVGAALLPYLPIIIVGGLIAYALWYLLHDLGYDTGFRRPTLNPPINLGELTGGLRLLGSAVYGGVLEGRNQAVVTIAEWMARAFPRARAIPRVEPMIQKRRRRSKFMCSISGRGHCPPKCITQFRGWASSEAEAEAIARAKCYARGCHQTDPNYNCTCGHLRCRQIS